MTNRIIIRHQEGDEFILFNEQGDSSSTVELPRPETFNVEGRESDLLSDLKWYLEEYLKSVSYTHLTLPTKA